MKNFIYLVILIFLLSGCAGYNPMGDLASTAAVELDADSNGGIDIGKGGTNATTEAGARTALGLAIGTDVLAPDGDGSNLTGVVASEVNDLETNGAASIADTEIFVGSGAGTGTYVAVSGDATLANTGAMTISADAIEESMLKAVDTAVDEECLTYESTTGDFEWQACSDTTVDDTAFAVSWNANTDAATKNSIYDQILLYDTDGDGDIDTLDGTLGGGNVSTSGTLNADEIAVFVAGAPVTDIKGLTEAEFKTAYNMEAGTDYQVYDANLTTYAGITPSANVQTLLGAADNAAFITSLGVDAAGTDNSTDVTIAVGTDAIAVTGQELSADAFVEQLADLTVQSSAILGVDATGNVQTYIAGEDLPIAIGVDAASFTGQLTVTDDTLQEVADAFDAYVIPALGVDTAELAADAVDGTKLADDSVDSEHYADASIDELHLNADNAATDNYVLSYNNATGGFTWVEDATGGTLADDSVTVAKMADGDWGDFTITTNSADLDANTVDSEHYVDGSIDLAHMSVDSVDSTQYVDGSVDVEHVEADLKTNTLIYRMSDTSVAYTDELIRIPTAASWTYANIRCDALDATAEYQMDVYDSISDTTPTTLSVADQLDLDDAAFEANIDISGWASVAAGAYVEFSIATTGSAQSCVVTFDLTND